MDDLAVLRADTDEALKEAWSEMPPDDPEIDLLLAVYFATREASTVFSEALAYLAENDSRPDAPSGKASESARRLAVPPKAISVGDLLSRTGQSQAGLRRQLSRTLGLNPSAAEMMLDRPAATLLHQDPTRVAELASVLETSPADLLRSVWASARQSGGAAFAYQPLATRDIAEPTDRPPSVSPPVSEWAAALLTARPADNPERPAR